MIVNGSLECTIGNDSRGIRVEAAPPESVPTIAAAVWNLRNIVSTTSAKGAVACWKGKDAIGAEAVVCLWEDPPLPGPFPQPEGE